ncbi:MAG: hypothetical protein FWF70_06415 [Bacteroidetes bacterium]|nr:hypothetical protein [Bacteroidota bacterium]MCL1968336.1 hypothetical protein [Bacteroidota bacterium]
MKKNLLFLLLLCIFSHAVAQEVLHRNVIKVTFLSFITGSTKITYERATFPHQSVEITGGIIGWGYDKFSVNPKGGLVRLAYKFILYSKYPAPLNGFYIKPELAFSHYHYNLIDDVNCNRALSSWITVMACPGYQWVKKWFVFDGFAGIGLGMGTKVDLRYHHGFIDRFKCVTLTFGMKVGVAFGGRNLSKKHVNLQSENQDNFN